MLRIAKLLTAILTVVLYSGIANAVPFSGIGPCPGGQAVNKLNAGAPPSCIPVGGTAGNAVSIQGVNISSSAPTNGQAICYVAANLDYEPCNVSGGFPLTSDVSAGTHKITNLAAPSSTGDALSQGNAASVSSVTSSDLSTFSVTATDTNKHLVSIPNGTAGLPLVSNGAGATDTHQFISPPAGGTGLTSIPSGSLLLGNGTSPLGTLPGVTGDILQGVTSGNPTFTATPQLGAVGGTTGSIKFLGSTSGSVGLTGPASGGDGSVFTLPSSDGLSGQAIVTDGSKHWSFANFNGNATSIRGVNVSSTSPTDQQAICYSLAHLDYEPCTIGAAGSFPLSANVSANSHKIQNELAAGADGDVLAFGQANGNVKNPLMPNVAAKGKFIQVNSTSMNVPAMTNAPVGSVQILTLYNFSGNNTSVTPPAGWTLLRQSADNLLYVFGHTVAGGEGTVTFTWTNSGTMNALETDLNNVNTAAPVDVANDSAGSGTTFTPTALVTTQSEDLILDFTGLNDRLGSTTGTVPFTNVSSDLNNNFNTVFVFGQPSIGTAGVLTHATFFGGSKSFTDMQLAIAPATGIDNVVVSNGDSTANITDITAVPGSKASISKHSINNVINVQAFGAVGDGLTDDTTSIQNAINFAAGATPPTLPVNAPHRPVYLPPTSMCYLITKPLQINYPNAEFYGNSGSNICQRYYGPAIINAGYQEDTLNLTTPISGVTGITNSLATTGCSGKSCGLILANEYLDKPRINGLSAYTIEFFHNQTVSYVVGQQLYEQGTTNISTAGRADTTSIKFDGSTHLECIMPLSTGTLTATSTTTPSTSTTHHYACVLDPNAGNATLRLFLDGTQIGTASSGSASTTKVDPFEAIPIDGAPGACMTTWPGSQSTCNTYKGTYGPFRWSSSARYTSNFTAPTADFTNDSNTLLILDFPNSPDMTTLAQSWDSGRGGAVNVYLPIHGGSGNNQIPNQHIHDLELCSTNSPFSPPSDGLFAVWSPLSVYERLSCSHGDFYGFDFDNNVYDSKVDSLISVGTPNFGQIGIHYGLASNENNYYNNLVDNYTVGFDYNPSGGSTDTKPTVTDRGGTIYSYVENQVQQTLIWPFEDEEAANSVKLASILSNSAFATSDVYNGQLNTRNGAPYLAMAGSNEYPVNFYDVFMSCFSCGVHANEAVHIINSPKFPVKIIGSDTAQLSGAPWTDSPSDVVVNPGNVNAPQGPFDFGTVSTNTTLTNLGTKNVVKISTLTTGLTYTLSTTGVYTGQTVEVRSFITGTIPTAPIFATSSGVFKWQDGFAPILSTQNGAEDIFNFTYDGTNWIENWHRLNMLTASTSIPGVTSCGTTPTVTAGSTDNLGEVTIGSAGPITSCQITFVTTRSKQPKCFLQDRSSFQSLEPTSLSTTGFTITALTDMTSDVIDWWCPVQ